MTAGSQQVPPNDGAEINPITAAARHRLMVLSILAIGVLVALAFATSRSETYTSQAGLLLDDPRNTALGDVRPLRDQLRYAADQVAIIRSSVVSARAARIANRAEPGIALTPRMVQKKVTVASSETSNYVTISAKAGTPGDARVIASAVVAAYRRVVAETLATETKATLSRLDDAIAATAATLARLDAGGASASRQEDVQGTLDALRDRRDDLLSANEAFGDGISLVAAAEPGRADEVGLKTILVVVLALFAVIAVAVAYVLEMRRPRIRSASTAEGLVGAPALLEVPALTPGAGAGDEAFDFLVLGVGLEGTEPAGDDSLIPSDLTTLTRQELTVLSLLGRGLGHQAISSRVPGMGRAKVDSTVKSLCGKLGEPDSAALAERASGLGDLLPGPDDARPLPAIIAVCAAEEGAGVTTLVAGAAIAAARAGRRVLVLDSGADDRGPADMAPGADDQALLSLVDILHGLRGTAAVPLVDGPLPGVVKVVRLGGAGQDATVLFRGGGLASTMRSLGEDFDLVIADVPAVLERALAAPILKAAESVIAVVPHESDAHLARRLRERLTLLDIQPIGLLYNRRPSSRFDRLRTARPIPSLAQVGRPAAPGGGIRATADNRPDSPKPPVKQTRTTAAAVGRGTRASTSRGDATDRARPEKSE